MNLIFSQEIVNGLLRVNTPLTDASDDTSKFAFSHSVKEPATQCFPQPLHEFCFQLCRLFLLQQTLRFEVVSMRIN